MGKTNKASTHREASEDRGNVSFPYATSMSTWTRVQPRGRIPELEDGGTEEGWAMRKGGEAPLGVAMPRAGTAVRVHQPRTGPINDRWGPPFIPPLRVSV